MPLLTIPEPTASGANAGVTASSGPRRLNLVFHGMMAFRDAGPQNYDVLIPFPGVTQHQAVFGNPLSCPADPYSCLTAFPSTQSFWIIDGVWDATGTPNYPSSANAVILNNKMLTLNNSGVRTVIRVPKPDIIRHYRGAEVRGLALTGDAPSQAALPHPPDVMYEATVFSYSFFINPQLVPRRWNLWVN